MDWAAMFAYFFSGAILANGVPHFVKGIVGEIHQSPFGKRSHPVVNVLWGAANFLGGSVLLAWAWDRVEAGTGEWVALGLGGIILAVSLAYYWGRPGGR